MKPRKDLTGKVFGRLTAMSYIPGGNGKRAKWECICTCGKTVQVQVCNLTSGHSTSCGCLQREPNPDALTHKPEYHVWRSMKGRTTNPSGTDIKHYAHVNVCARWLDSFEAFYADMGPRPSSNHSIERKDGNKDYTPDNCVWATASEQARNRSTSRFITFEGKTLTVAEWSEITGIHSCTIRARLDVQGWDVTKTLTTRVNNGRSK